MHPKPVTAMLAAEALVTSAGSAILDAWIKGAVPSALLAAPREKPTLSGEEAALE